MDLEYQKLHARQLLHPLDLFPFKHLCYKHCTKKLNYKNVSKLAINTYLQSFEMMITPENEYR
jgi:hypothetical protein